MNEKTPTLFKYLKDNLVRKDGPAIDHMLRAELVVLHGQEYIKFYIHPHGMNGETPFYMIANYRQNEIRPAHHDSWDHQAVDKYQTAMPVPYPHKLG